MENKQHNADSLDNGQNKGEIDRSTGKRVEDTPIYLTSDSTLQTPAEHRHDVTREVSGDDLRDIKLGKLTGRDDANDNER